MTSRSRQRVVTGLKSFQDYSVVDLVNDSPADGVTSLIVFCLTVCLVLRVTKRSDSCRIVPSLRISPFADRRLQSASTSGLRHNDDGVRCSCRALFFRCVSQLRMPECYVDRLVDAVAEVGAGTARDYDRPPTKWQLFSPDVFAVKTGSRTP